MERGEKRLPEYSTFKEQEKDFERKAEYLRKKGEEILARIRELEQDVQDFEQIARDHFTSGGLKARMQNAIGTYKDNIEGLKRDMEAIRTKSTRIRLKIDYVRQQDAKWEALVKAKKNGPFPEG